MSEVLDGDTLEEPLDEVAPAGEDLAAALAEEQAARELAERNALAAVFDDVRAQSADSCLVEPTRWAELGLVPEHLTPDEFEMFVYEYLEDEQAARAEAAAETKAVPAKVYRSATRAVGVPPAIVPPTPVADGEAEEGAAVEEDAPAGAPEDVPEPVAVVVPEPAQEPGDDRSPFANLNIPEGYELVELEGEWVLVPTDEAPAPIELPIVCENVVALVGAHSYYLYDRGFMTDTFAHWAFLAAEDDNVVTFVDCVREDSRVYPRPMPAQSLKNAPFRLSADEIEQVWNAVNESGAYPDIQQTIASNGDVYYFSTDYLSPAYAGSLAEWDAVERYMNV